MARPPRFDSVLSFSHAPAGPDADRPTSDEAEAPASDAGSSDGEGFEFEFAFAPPLAATAGREAEDALAPADDLFAHGRILPAYPVFDRHLLRGHGEAPAAAQHQASTGPPSPDTYCAWAPRSAPGSPSRFPKSASTGEARRWSLRDLVGAGGRSHSDGKEKFVFLQPATPSKMSGKVTVMAAETTVGKQSAKPSTQQQHKQSKKKSKAAATEMDMATAHRLFYGKQDAGGDRRQHSYLPYRPGIVGFFATAHALGRSHQPY